MVYYYGNKSLKPYNSYRIVTGDIEGCGNYPREIIMDICGYEEEKYLGESYTSS